MPATRNKSLSFLKTLITYAQSKGYVEHNPILSLKTRGNSVADPKPLTQEQMAYLEVCELPPVLRHYCDSWLVAGELCLHHSDFCKLPQFKFITLSDGKRIAQHNRSKQHGSKLLQTVDVTARAERILTKYGGPEGLLYVSSAHYSRHLKQVARIADLRDSEDNLVELQFGQGRDTGLTERAIAGATQVQLSKMAGWSKPVYANRYIGHDDKIVEAYIQKCPVDK